MSDYIENATTGIVSADTSDIKTEVQNEFKAALGQDLDTTDSTPQGRLIEAETVARKRTMESMAMLANTFNPQQSFGIFLDALAALFSIQRTGSTATRVLCQLSGTPDTIIPANSQAQDSTGKIYYAEDDMTLDSEGNNNGYFVCSQKGEIECPANSLNKIVTAITGWDSINNSSAGVVGKTQESDSSLRDRIKRDQFTGSALLNAIHSAIMRVENVEDCLVRDNPTNANDTSTILGITIPPHSLFICVEGGTNADIAQAIFDTKSGGCGYTTGTGHTQTVQVEDKINGQFYNVSFDRPVYQAIDVEVELATGQATAPVKEQVKQAIIDYANGKISGVDGLTIGKNVSPFEIASAITQELPELYIASVKVAEHGDTPAATEISIALNEKATISETDITVS